LIFRRSGLWLACFAITGIISRAEFRYSEALPGYVYHFPADYFLHPDYKTEWWYYTGNLTDPDGRKFGFELVFFRQGSSRDQLNNPSAWRIDDVYLAHAAVTDIGGKRFHYFERLNRAGPGLAGASQARDEVWNGNWRARWNGERQDLTAVTEDFQFDLRAEPLKPLVIHGLDGISQKADGPGHASHYISFTRMGVSGDLVLGGEKHRVSGLAWMDHEWFTNQLDPSQVGWDWFSVQLDDNTEMMLVELRKKDGSIDPHSSGTYVDAGGKAHHLSSAEFSLRPAAHSGRYPVRWRIEAALADQELRTAGANYWEGAVTYSGSKKGVGYLEMTGYDKPVNLN
jgi:predicted secreted hydrolase